jgi:hypothetical protein
MAAALRMTPNHARMKQSHTTAMAIVLLDTFRCSNFIHESLSYASLFAFMPSLLDTGAWESFPGAGSQSLETCGFCAERRCSFKYLSLAFRFLQTIDFDRL